MIFYSRKVLRLRNTCAPLQVTEGGTSVYLRPSCIAALSLTLCILLNFSLLNSHLTTHNLHFQSLSHCFRIPLWNSSTYCCLIPKSALQFRPLTPHILSILLTSGFLASLSMLLVLIFSFFFFFLSYGLLITIFFAQNLTEIWNLSSSSHYFLILFFYLLYF